MRTRPVSKTRKDKKVPDKIWDLKLYVIDRTLKSVAAFTNLTRICHDHLEGKCRISVIDIEKRPGLAKENQIVAIPTLVKTFPLPVRRVIGDLSNTERVLAGLDLFPVIKKNVPITHRLHGRP
ncbi:MAG: circadian clock protein KaiB [Deltaproteobacteria bacterium]|nr:MAG: circadian clock protein KaiB [Deltaproteobacteria bacterium]